MAFTTPVPIVKSAFSFGYDASIGLLGSCFAEHIAAKFSYYQFDNWSNPFGILFQPAAIEQIVQMAVNEHKFTQSDIFFHNERWHCYDAHSVMSDQNEAAILLKLNLAVSLFRSQIINASHLVITYGTAWVYRKKADGNLVANCHKVPQMHFEKELLSVDAVAKSITETIRMIRLLNPEIELIFTISPVRHLKDGFVGNQRSKAHLIAGLHQAIANQKAVYFPSYEIVMDELRDYRFFTSDLLHPNELAVDYIWQRFVQTFLNAAALPIMERVAQIRSGLSHRPFSPDTQSHQDFVSKLQLEIADLQLQHPHIRF